MRTVYGPTGSDVTSTVKSMLSSQRTLVMANMYSFMQNSFWVYNPFGFCAYFTFTDADIPISVSQLQLFSSGGPTDFTALNNGRMTYVNSAAGSSAVLFSPKEAIKRSTMSWGVGFEASDVTVEWTPDPTTDYFRFVGVYGPLQQPAVNVLSMTQAMTTYKAFDNVPFWIHRAYFTDFPNKGGTFLGTSLMFRGFLKKIQGSKAGLKLTVGSMLQLIQDAQVPSQLIQANNRNIPFLPMPNGGNFGVPSTIFSPLDILFTGTGALTQDELKDSWVTFTNATGYYNYAPQNGLPPFATPGWRIRGNTPSTAGSCTVSFYTPPIIPNVVFNANIFTQNTGTAQGFKYVPPPEMSI